MRARVSPIYGGTQCLSMRPALSTPTHMWLVAPRAERPNLGPAWAANPSRSLLSRRDVPAQDERRSFTE